MSGAPYLSRHSVYFRLVPGRDIQGSLQTQIAAYRNISHVMASLALTGFYDVLSRSACQRRWSSMKLAMKK